MATRDTRNDAQEMIDFMLAKRPEVEFKITEVNYIRGNGLADVMYEVFEKSVCTRCDKTMWHIDYGNERVAHADCEIAAAAKFDADVAAHIEQNEKRNAILNYIANTDD